MNLRQRRYLITCLLLFSFLCDAFPLDTSVDIKDDNTPIPIDDSLDKLHAKHSKTEVYIMYSLDLIILQLGSLCTLYVIIRTSTRWFKHNLSLHMSHKLPFYVALSINIFFYFIFYFYFYSLFLLYIYIFSASSKFLFFY